jgi:Arf-GAP/Rho-GAP domain/ANK repeat/PH domain-containing protein 3
MGWALKSSSKKAPFSKKQKDYLIEKFQIGEKNSQKADPACVARAMMTARNVNGERMFTSNGISIEQSSSVFSALICTYNYF